MSKEGYKHFPRKTRKYIKRTVFYPELRIDVAVTEIDTKEKIMKLAEDQLGAGIWVMRGITKAKTKTRRKWVRLAKVTTRETKDGFHSTISDTWRLQRYWFWREKNKKFK